MFRVACEGVAYLHSYQVFQWSAHGRNLFRVGERWKLGDFSRSVVLTSDADARFLRAFPIEPRPDGSIRNMLEVCPAGPWTGRRSPGFAAHSPDRERRLRQDDCAMLGGLLCDLLGVNRWATFHQALTDRPLCSGRYRLTGHRRTDDQLSAILNTCWRGDAGGAVLLANGGQGDQTTYADALALLDDVAAVLGRGPAKDRPNHRLQDGRRKGEGGPGQNRSDPGISREEPQFIGTQSPEPKHNVDQRNHA